MIGRVFDFLSKDMAMDLGTANTLIYIKGKGVVLDEPSVVTLERQTSKTVAVGREARNLVGRHGKDLVTSRPLKDGVIHDFETATYMIKSFLGKILNKFPLSRPRLVIAVPAGITSVEKRAVVEAAEVAGAGKIFLIEEPMAAAIGSGLSVEEHKGQMIVDVGGGTTEVAIVSRCSIACAECIRVAGDEIDAAICDYIRKEYRMDISDMMGELLKIKLGSVVPLKKNLQIKLRGKDIVTNMPKVVTISDTEIREAIQEPTKIIIDAVRKVLEKASPVLASDVADNGIWVAGGGSLLRGLRLLIHHATGLEVKQSEDPLRSVIRGAGAVTEDLDFYRDVFIN